MTRRADRRSREDRDDKKLRDDFAEYMASRRAWLAARARAAQALPLRLQDDFMAGRDYSWARGDDPSLRQIAARCDYWEWTERTDPPRCPLLTPWRWAAFDNHYLVQAQALYADSLAGLPVGWALACDSPELGFTLSLLRREGVPPSFPPLSPRLCKQPPEEGTRGKGVGL